MLLGDVRDYVMQREEVTLHDIAARFDVSDDTAQFALDYWVNKKHIRYMVEGCGSSCGSCSAGSGRYQWIKTEFPLQWLRRT